MAKKKKTQLCSEMLLILLKLREIKSLSHDHTLAHAITGT